MTSASGGQPPKPTVRGPTRIQSIARAVRVLLYVAEEPSGRTAGDIAKEFGITVPTAHHILNTLVDEGVVTKDRGRQYRLGPRVGVLVDAYLRNTAPPAYLLDPLRLLAEKTGETAYVCSWRDGGVEVLASIEGAHAMRVVGLQSGFQAHAHARAAGKALLAYLDSGALDAYVATHKLERLTPSTIADERALREELRAIRARGYAIDSEEFMEGVSCVAAPILQDDVAIAAYSLSAPTWRFERNKAEYIEAVTAAARKARLT